MHRMLLKWISCMTNDMQAKILASSFEKLSKDTGGKNSKDAEFWKFKNEVDILLKNKYNKSGKRAM